MRDNQNRPYAQLANKAKHKKIWNVAKIIAIMLNAIAILWIGIEQIAFSRQSNSVETKVEQLDSLVNEQSNKLIELDNSKVELSRELQELQKSIVDTTNKNK